MRFDARDFLEKYKEDQFFVAFLKGKKEWFPVCLSVDGIGESGQPDILCVSEDEAKIRDFAEFMRERISSLEAVEVLYLFPVEIKNLVERYGFDKIELFT